MKNINFSKNIKVFCNKNNIDLSLLKPLKNDASKRKYYRFTNNNKEFLLMDSSLEKKSLSKFIHISEWLNKSNYSAPNIYKKDAKNGLLLIENFGKEKFSYVMKKNKSNKLFFYKKAIDFLNPPNDCELIDIKPQGISAEDLEQMRAHTDSYESLFSRRAMLFRQRNLGDQTLTEEDYKKLILEHYTFLKRPVILTSNAVFTGSAKKSLEAAQKALHE